MFRGLPIIFRGFRERKEMNNGAELRNLRGKNPYIQLQIMALILKSIRSD